MKKLWLFFLLTITLACGAASCNPSNCANRPTDKIYPEADLSAVGYPQMPKGSNEQILHRRSYTVSYNSSTLCPNWVAWRITAAHANNETVGRSNDFHEDDQVPEPRATLDDYRGSGYSRGHMCPAGDNKWDKEAMYQTFLLTNMCPQNSGLNSGVWNQIEMSCRQWAKKYGEVYVVCGPLYLHQKHQTIGPNRVVVPEAFFKVVLCPKPLKAIGFICRNTTSRGHKKTEYVNSVAQVERITGIKFFPLVNAAVKNQADLNAW